MQSNPRPAGRYLKALGIGTAIVAGLVICLNVVVDPYGVYRGFGRGWNTGPRAGMGSRIAMAERLRQAPWDTVFLGTSRVAVLNEHSPELQGRATLNLSMQGASFTETEAILRYSIRAAGIKRAIILVDFFQFNVRDKRIYEIDRTLFNPDLSAVEYHSDKLLGWEATAHSYYVLRDAWKGVPRGAALDLDPDRGDTAPRRRYEENVRHFLKNRMLYRQYRYSPDQLESFRRSVATAHAAGVELYIAVSPVHAIQLETVRAAGQWEQFENWKRDLVRIVAEENQTAGRQARLWDFTGYTSYPADEMPGPESQTPSKYYWESSHFKPILGEILLKRILTPEQGDPTFGVPIGPANVEQQLAQIRQDRARWRQGHGAEIEWVQSIAAQYGMPSPEALATRPSERPAR